MSGVVSFLSGLAAEDGVAAEYTRHGAQIAARRWRGSHGEIDLVMRDKDGLIFIEVKKSRSFEHAAARLTEAQMQRIYGAASEFLAGEPTGQDTNVRFDLALVDSAGRTRIIENAFGF